MTMLEAKQRIREAGPSLLAGFAILCLITGGIFHLSGETASGGLIWSLGAGAVFVVLIVDIGRALLGGRFGVDILAALSIGVAITLDEILAAAIVAVMYAGGQLLESHAEGRARRNMAALLGRISRTAMRYSNDHLETVAIEALCPRDRILMRRGEVVPVDGRLLSDAAVLDLAALTGEAMPQRFAKGQDVPSGATVVGDAFDLLVLRESAASTYAGIVRLVEQAQTSRAPMARLADRYAVLFLIVTLVLAGGAFWWSGDATRALAVLVVATPCPLILAVPVAVIAGMSRAAAHGVLIKTGAALEMLASVTTVVLDKTGTVTAARPEVQSVAACPGFEPDAVLRLAASLDQASSHVAAEALVRAALDRKLELLLPRDVVEFAGEGLSGTVGEQVVTIGGRGFVKSKLLPGEDFSVEGIAPDTAMVAVGINGRAAGLVLLSDPLREDAPAMIDAFRKAGIKRILMASGDKASVAQRAAAQLNLDGVEGDLSPQGKVAMIAREQHSAKVMMVGDGVNDAPALATADVGIAVAVRGSAASSEAADVVLLADNLTKLSVAIGVASRARRIARQSATAGLALSAVAMVAAAVGYLSPVQGALLQEVIDVAVVVNALRALKDAA
ncbi:heavy metal translocating P-type ATPase [Rhizobium sp. AAP43]|uniref:heavy metal translocating P-type ATPase n=1 Tax=Rhizobium sp. AAP43 TaxID=1523420 RepID=UPI0006B941DC|nr:heavy metal translocating P-type ATPase [Rhizobium sp. AAP43]KPF44956.1 haloacid dehalogenase [Rhizobium sp. AAP43]